MRLVSILTAVLVLSGLYALVFERDAVKAISQGAPLTILFSEIGNHDGKLNYDTDTKTGSVIADDVVLDKMIKVVAIKSIATEIGSAVILRGQTEAAREVEVRAETSGQVVSEPLRKGRFVRTGQTLCQLDVGTRESRLLDVVSQLAEAEARVPETQARLNEAESRLGEARINFHAAEKLAKDGYATETRLAATKAAVRSAEASVASALAGFKATHSGIQTAEAAVAAARKEIDRLTLRAPFAGLLESDTAEIGSLLQPGALCATIIQLDPIKLVGFVAEVDMPRVKVGARAKAELLAGKSVNGTVTFLSRSADELTRTFRVEIDVPNADLSISDGQTAEISITAEGKTAHLVPQSALTLSDTGDLGVRLISENSTAKFSPVYLMRDTSEGVWLSGLPQEVEIIIVGQEYVVDGVPVLPTFREAFKE